MAREAFPPRRENPVGVKDRAQGGASPVPLDGREEWVPGEADRARPWERTRVPNSV